MRPYKKQRYTNGTEYKAQEAVSPKTRYSTFNLDQQIKTTYNVGELVPFYLQEVLPGDEFKISTAIVARTTTLITPIMDNLYEDIYYFFVPNRIIWEHWVELMGENKKGPWATKVEHTVPKLDLSTTNFGLDDKTKDKKNADILKNPAQYLGIPIDYLKKAAGSKTTLVSSLPLRGYQKIYDDWFRDENLQEPPLINMGDDADKLENFKLYKANKYADYFTKALPSAQKGEPIVVNLGGNIPLKNLFDTKENDGGNGTLSVSWDDLNKNKTYVKILTAFRDKDGNIVKPKKLDRSEVIINSASGNQNYTGNIPYGTTADNGTHINMSGPTIEGLYLDASQATGISINELREAFALQKMLEKDARGGTRYVEMIETHFGVRANDARLQRSEYLGGLHQIINTQQVSQTTPAKQADATTDDGLGALGAYSLTNAYTKNFDHFFEEHGYVIGIATVRYNHTYQQGIKRTWLRETRNEYYDPTFANIGEQPIYNAEIYANNTETDKQGFGFQEAWADYRFNPNMTTGMFNSYYDQSLDYWHMADKYDSLPTLSPEWIEETPVNFDRDIQIGHENVDQILTDILVQNKATRPMPVYSIPGNIDMD